MANTEDTRESPANGTANSLLKEKASLVIYDMQTLKNAKYYLTDMDA